MNNTPPEPILTAKEKRAAYDAAWYLANKEKRAAYRLRNKEKIVARQAAWYLKNQEIRAAHRLHNQATIAEYNRAYRVANPEAHRRAERRRNARKRNNGVAKYTEQQVLDLHGTDCHICKLPIDFNAPRLPGKHGWELGFHIDHLIPISKGGPDTLQNVKPAHGRCNISKGSKHDDSDRGETF